MRPSRRSSLRSRRLIGLGAALLGVALVAGACLPAGVRPTPTPLPTPMPSPTPPPTPSPTPGPPTPTPAPTFEVYTVKRGDTLVEIARRFRTDGRSIAYWNREQHPSLDPESSKYEPDDIKVGWTLRILRGGAYVPPEDDGESGEFYSPPPEDLEPVESEDGASGSPSSSTAP